MSSEISPHPISGISNSLSVVRATGKGAASTDNRRSMMPFRSITASDNSNSSKLFSVPFRNRKKARQVPSSEVFEFVQFNRKARLLSARRCGQRHRDKGGGNDMLHSPLDVSQSCI